MTENERNAWHYFLRKVGERLAQGDGCVPVAIVACPAHQVDGDGQDNFRINIERPSLVFAKDLPAEERKLLAGAWARGLSALEKEVKGDVLAVPK